MASESDQARPWLATCYPATLRGIAGAVREEDGNAR